MTIQRISCRLRRAIAIGLTGTCLAGCGTLKVTMEVLDPEVVQQQMDQQLVAKLLPIVLASTPESIKTDVDKLKDAHRRAYQRLAAMYEAEAKKLPQPGQGSLIKLAKTLVADFDGNTGEFYLALRKDLTAYRGEVLMAMGGRYAIATGDANYPTVLRLLQVWQQRVTQASAVIAKDINNFVADAAMYVRDQSPGALAVPDAHALVSAELAAVNAQLAQISIQGSPVAYAVANAPDSKWGERYNQVIARSAGGASDVAIKLDPHTGNYLLKGLSFDPADVAAVASKVTTQALLVAAQIAGVPIKPTAVPSDGTSGKALALSSGALADAQATMETQRAQDEARKAALIALANVIVNEEKDLLSPDEVKRKAAVAAIRTAFEKRLSIIRPTSP